MSVLSSVNSTTITSSDNQITSSTKNTLGKDDFLKLLITELTHQDPLDPLKDRDFVTQLAQFSSLEQVTQMSKSMENFFNSLEFAVKDLQLIQASQMIGRNVKVQGVTSFEVEDGKIPSITFSLDRTSSVKVKIYDTLGNLVTEKELGVFEPGEHSVVPDADLSDGLYRFIVIAKDDAGNEYPLNTYGWAKVNEVSVEQNAVYLILENGDKINISQIRQIS